MTDLNTPHDVAIWFNTANPTPDAANHALDQLVDTHGHENGLRVWCTGIRLAEAVRGSR